MVMAYDLSRLLAQLTELADERYRRFNEGLMPGMRGTSLGVRMPALRRLVRGIAAEDPQGFLDASLGAQVHELNLLHAMVLARRPNPERMARLRAFVPTLANWSVCDLLCGELKPAPADLDELAAFLDECIASGAEYPVRFAYVARMLYYRDDAHIEQTLQRCAAFRHEGYYARMGVAWGLSMLFLCQRARTLRFLETNALDRFTHNMTIRKAIESRRVTDADRALLRALARPPR